MNDLYRWRYPVRTDVLHYCPGRVLSAARDAAIRDAAEDGYRPGSLPHITAHPAPGAWTTVQVEFDAVPIDQSCDLSECVDCGQRPAWGPGARRCRTCFAQRDRAAVFDDPGGFACAELAGTHAGYQRHIKAGETTCRPCRAAMAARKRRDREAA